MQDYVKRMIDEKKEVDGRMEKLNRVLCDDDFKKNIGKEKTHLMSRQLIIMLAYSEILKERLDLEDTN